MDLQVNSLIKYHDVDDKVYRVLYITPTQVVVFDITRGVAAEPVIKLKEALVADFNSVRAHILDIDPEDERLLVSEEHLSEQACKKRDFAWEVVTSFALNADGTTNVELFKPSSRANLIKEAAQKFGLNPKTVLKYLRNYWRGKQVKNALLDRYENCGGRGQQRTREDKKIGRPNQKEKEQGFVDPLYDSDQVRMIFQEAIDKKYGRGVKLTEVLQYILETYYVQGYREDNGKKIPVLYAPELRPTYKQLYYYFINEWMKNPEKYQRKRYGNRRYDLNHRAIVSESTSMSFGPGSLYQVDATVCDVHLVSSFGREKLIGRPQIYVVSDVFSRSVAGFCVTLENQGWVGSLPCLDNAFTEKVGFCAEYGITITKDKWPVAGMPKRLIADRAEFISHFSDNLAEVGVRISNTPPYRAEWKGIVERRIGIVNKHSQKLPGGVDKDHQRGDFDYRTKACLTPREFTEILILTFLYYNNHHRLKEYIPDEFMIKDDIPLIPSVLWNWGIENRVGTLKQLNRDFVRFNLLPRAEASISEKGFHFNKKIYHSDIPLAEQRLMIIAREKGRKKYPIVYDPRRPDEIYLQLEERSSLMPLRLSEQYKSYMGLHEMEWNNQDDQDRINNLSLLGDEQQARAELDAKVEAIVEPAQKEAEQVKKGLPKTVVTGNMRENRSQDKEVERNSIQNATTASPKTPAEIVPRPQHAPVARPNNLSVLRQAKQEENNG